MSSILKKVNDTIFRLRYCRVDYVQPTEDRLVPKKSLDQILAAKPDVVVHRIAGPHLIMQTNPMDVWKILIAPN